MQLLQLGHLLGVQVHGHVEPLLGQRHVQGAAVAEGDEGVLAGQLLGGLAAGGKPVGGCGINTIAASAAGAADALQTYDFVQRVQQFQSFLKRPALQGSAASALCRAALLRVSTIACNAVLLVISSGT